MEAKWIALVVRVLFKLKLAKTPFQMMYRITSHLISTRCDIQNVHFGVGGWGGWWWWWWWWWWGGGGGGVGRTKLSFYMWQSCLVPVFRREYLMFCTWKTNSSIIWVQSFEIPPYPTHPPPPTPTPTPTPTPICVQWIISRTDSWCYLKISTFHQSQRLQQPSM